MHVNTAKNIIAKLFMRRLVAICTTFACITACADQVSMNSESNEKSYGYNDSYAYSDNYYNDDPYADDYYYGTATTTAMRTLKLAMRTVITTTQIIKIHKLKQEVIVVLGVFGQHRQWK